MSTPRLNNVLTKQERIAELARERDLPVVIHTREADDDTLRIVEDVLAGQINEGIARQIEELGGRAMNLNFYLLSLTRRQQQFRTRVYTYVLTKILRNVSKNFQSCRG